MAYQSKVAQILAFMFVNYS